MSESYFETLGKAVSREFAKKLDNPQTFAAVRQHGDRILSAHIARPMARDATISEMPPRGGYNSNDPSEVDGASALEIIKQLLSELPPEESAVLLQGLTEIVATSDPDDLDNTLPGNENALDRGRRGGRDTHAAYSGIGRRGSARDNGGAPNGLNGPRHSAAAMDAAIRDAESRARDLRIARANAQANHTEDFFRRFPDAAKISF